MQAHGARSAKVQSARAAADPAGMVIRFSVESICLSSSAWQQTARKGEPRRRRRVRRPHRRRIEARGRLSRYRKAERDARITARCRESDIGFSFARKV